MSKTLQCPACEEFADNYDELAACVDEHMFNIAPKWESHFNCFCGLQWSSSETEDWNEFVRHIQEVCEKGELKAHFVLGALTQ